MFNPGDKVVCVGRQGRPLLPNQKVAGNINIGEICHVTHFIPKEAFVGWLSDGVGILGRNSGHPQNVYDANCFRKVWSNETKIVKHEEIRI